MKERITITIEKDLLFWLDTHIERRIFANRSHALEFLVHKKRNQDEKQDNSQY